MSERDWAESPYVRVYQTIKSDPKFSTVYEDDRALAGWVRLLLDSDAAYPARLAVPASLSRHAREVLVKAGLMVIANGTYTLSGLSRERQSRAKTSAERVRAWRERREKSRGVTVNPVTNETKSNGEGNGEVTLTRGAARASVSASVLRSNSSELASEPASQPAARAREAGQAPLMEAIAYIEERTRRPWVFGEGSKLWDTLEPDVRDFGWPKVKAAMEAEKAPFPDAGQLVFGASRRLHPISGAMAAEPDDDWVKTQLAARKKARPAHA